MWALVCGVWRGIVLQGPGLRLRRRKLFPWSNQDSQQERPEYQSATCPAGGPHAPILYDLQRPKPKPRIDFRACFAFTGAISRPV